ncbi:hypothetical protein QEN19_003514 [Hanseniaspora menglaensis]
MALLKSNKRTTITGKSLNNKVVNTINIKPKNTKKIINRYHFLIKCRAYIFELLKISLGQTDDEMEINLFVQEFLKKKLKNSSNNKIDFENELLQLKRGHKTNDKSREQELLLLLKFITTEIVDNGGLQRYQQASIMGQQSDRGGDSSKKLMEWILELSDAGKEIKEMVTLEIGSLRVDNVLSKNKYKKFIKSIERIDLNSNHPDINKQDFLLREQPKDASEQFGLISCSLVVNFVPDEYKRGEMLRRLKQFCLPDGLVFLVLPLSCVENSRFMTSEILVNKIMHQGLNFKLLKEHKSNKIVYYLFQNIPSTRVNESYLKKNFDCRKHIDEDSKRKHGKNNFSISF